MKYAVITKINKVDYLVIVEAESNSGAEHIILDKGVCTSCEYSVEASQAFDKKDMKTEFFISWALECKTVSLEEINIIITKRNDEITARENARKEIRRIEKEMKALTEALESAKKVLAE